MIQISSHIILKGLGKKFKEIQKIYLHFATLSRYYHLVEHITIISPKLSMIDVLDLSSDLVSIMDINR